MESAANDFFEQILPEKSNADLFNEAIMLDQLREEVVSCLKRIESSPTPIKWWEDKELIGLFCNLHTSGVITLPKDAVERLRWIAMLCVEISNEEGYDCGGVVLIIDFLPEDLMEMFEGVYDMHLFIEVFKFRQRLSQLGWDIVFGK